MSMRIQALLLALIFLLACSPVGQVKFTEGDGEIGVHIDGKPFTTLYYGTGAPKPYLHPLRAASGTIVTRRFPMEDVEGERQDHPHHRGLWFTHGEVNGDDFWANEPDRDFPHKGTVSPGEVRTEGDSIVGSFVWNDRNGKPIVREDRTMRFHAGGPNRVIDFDLRLTALDGEVHFGDTKEGTFAIRVATPLEEQHARATGVERTGVLTAANGKTGEKAVWGKRSPWMDYSGAIDGEKLGIAIFDHPSNPKHPTYWHVRSYGLFAANIFGEHHFYADDSKDGSITLQSGESLRFQYRVVIHPADVRSADVAGLYAKYKSEPSSSQTK